MSPLDTARRPLPRAPGPSLSLLDRQLVIVTGKGGTGKTTLSAALAVAGARSGRRVLVAEMGPDEHLPGLLQPGAAPVGYAGRELQPSLWAMRIDPFAALAEYLGIQIGLRSIVDRVVANPAFRQLMTAAPGWRDHITLGKVWHAAQQQRPGGGRAYDLVVVDAPATGHGVTFLDVPRVVVSAVRAGPLRSHTEAVEAMLADPERTAVLPVALAEELPARETADLVERVRDGLGLTVDRIVVNGVFGAPFPAGLDDLDEWLEALDPERDLGDGLAASALARCARFLRARYELNRRYVRTIGESTGLPVVCLPYLRDGVRGPRDVETLSRELVPDAEARLER